MVVRRHEGAQGAFTLEVTPRSAGWERAGLRILELPSGGSQTIRTPDAEVALISLSGSATVDVDGEVQFTLHGRPGVLAGPSDVVYVPRGSTFSVISPRGGRFALCSAVCTTRLPPSYLPAADVPVELRGTSSASRQVHNFGVPGVLEADRLIACEVITPGGNWSSWPPHKHDEERDGETRLEEIYYYETEGPAYQRVYGSTDVLTEVRSGDAVLIPHGWHGPSMAAPGYDLYYLNVMAGPGPQRAWLIRDDPDHAWVRETWPSQPVDPRLPYGDRP
nr:5-deoxy-glucuronate isomerase [Kineosporia mesophila]